MYCLWCFLAHDGPALPSEMYLAHVSAALEPQGLTLYSFFFDFSSPYSPILLPWSLSACWLLHPQHSSWLWYLSSHSARALCWIRSCFCRSPSVPSSVPLTFTQVVIVDLAFSSRVGGTWVTCSGWFSDLHRLFEAFACSHLPCGSLACDLMVMMKMTAMALLTTTYCCSLDIHPDLDGQHLKYPVCSHSAFRTALELKTKIANMALRDRS